MIARSEVTLVRQALSKSEVVNPVKYLQKIADALADNLDTPKALNLIVDWAKECLDETGATDFENSAGQMSRGIDSLLGLSF